MVGYLLVCFERFTNWVVVFVIFVASELVRCGGLTELENEVCWEMLVTEIGAGLVN